MWDNIGKVAENRKTGIHFLPERRESIDSATGTPSNRAMEIYANCQSATKGMLAGTATYLFSITLISLIFEVKYAAAHLHQNISRFADVSFNAGWYVCLHF